MLEQEIPHAQGKRNPSKMVGVARGHQRAVKMSFTQLGAAYFFAFLYPASEVRGSGREEQPHIQGAVAARAQEGLEELSHVEGQEGRQ